jgi:hypothetical protein
VLATVRGVPYRLIYIGLALVGLAAIALGLALSREGEAVELPGPVESVSPQPGDLVPPQTTLEIDLEVGYDAAIFVDGWPVTDATFVEATGVYRWAPGPSHPTIQEWFPGEHTVRIVYDTYSGLPDQGTFEWSFRVG